MDFERKPSISSSVTQDDVHKLLNFMYVNSLNNSSRNSDEVAAISRKCKNLFEHDYQIEEISNADGNLCPHYPPQIYIPVLEKHSVTLAQAETGSSVGLGPTTVEELEYLMQNARNARVRGRFVVPVLLCNGKYLCRSGTISAWAETYGLHAYKTAQNYASKLMMGRPRGESEPVVSTVQEEAQPEQAANTPGDIFDKHRGFDKKLLAAMNIKYISDLMVENKKYRSYIPFPLSSSEKIDKSDRYRSFTVLIMPFPGCEFFKVWSSDENCAMQEVQFDWSTPGVNAALNVSAPAPRSTALISWAEYRAWDLSVLTENYLRLLLGYLVEGSDGGVLVHCLSGWDRTPLFCSLIRLLLWADGLAHASLNPLEMLYFTLAYDWFLFAHQLPDRLSKKEEILKFCFHFINYVKDKREISMLEYYSDGITEEVWKERLERIDCLWKAFSALQSRVEEAHSLTQANRSSSFGGLLNSLASKMRTASGTSLNHSMNGSDAAERY